MTPGVPTGSPLAGQEDPVRLTGGTLVAPLRSEPLDVILQAGAPVMIIERDEPHAAQIIDITDHLVAPGLIDTQINGAYGHDFTDDPHSVWTVGQRLPAHGVTAYLPTLVSPTEATISTAQRVLAAGPPPLYAGAWPLGLHLEGPLLSLERPGTHPPARLRQPRDLDVSSWTRANGIAMVTLAPELPGALDVAAELAAAGILVAAGHTAATYETAVLAATRGVRHATHLFNAMRPMTHREPGIAGFFLTQPDVTASFIADGVHSHPAVAGIAWRSLGPDRLVLVSDAVAAMGLPPGRFRLAGMTVDSDGTRARGPTGSLAGSVAAPDEMLRRFARHARTDITRALPALTNTPSSLLGEQHRGELVTGARGDVAVLDTDGTVVMTFIDGRLVHAARHVATHKATANTA